MQISKNQLGLSAGLKQTYFEDAIFSPLNYTGTGFAIDLAYKRQLKKEAIFTANIAYSHVLISNEVSSYTESVNSVIDIKLTYLRKLKSSTEKFKYYLGTGLSTHINYLSFEDQDAITYFNLHSLHLAAAASYALGTKQQLSLGLHLPVLGLIIRPAYTGWDNDSYDKSPIALLYEGELTSLHNFFAFSLQGGYSYGLSPKMQLVLQAQLQYQQTEHRAAAKNVHIQTAIGLNFNL